jgi:N utilization substance protein B
MLPDIMPDDPTAAASDAPIERPRRRPRKIGTQHLHRARALAMQALYAWDVSGIDPHRALDELAELGTAPQDPDEVVAIGEIVPPDVSARTWDLAHQLVGQVVAHRDEIDARLAAAAPHRPLEQMARVEKAILRLAICEILYNNAVPARAAINEAVELAKQFGAEHSSRFVNGVLGTIFSQAEASPSSENPESEVT